MKSFSKKYEINSPISSVWDALTSPDLINKWGGGPAKMNEVVGSEFSLWGGDIHGINTRIVKEKQLDQDWMAGNWNTYSKVSFKLSFKDGQTAVILTHDNIPDNEYDDIVDGWDRYYMNEIKKYLENK